MTQENHYQLEKDYKQYHELCAALNSLESLIYSDFFKSLLVNTQKHILDTYIQKLNFKTIINQEVFIDPAEIYKNHKRIKKLKQQFSESYLNGLTSTINQDSTTAPKPSLMQWSVDHVFFYNNYRLKNVYPMALEEGVLRTLNLNAPSLRQFNKTTGSVSAGSSTFINVIRECVELSDMLIISSGGSGHISFGDKLSVLFEQRFTKLFGDFYWSIFNGLSFFRFREHAYIKDKLTGIGFGLDILMTYLDIRFRKKQVQQLELAILSHISSLCSIKDQAFLAHYLDWKLSQETDDVPNLKFLALEQTLEQSENASDIKDFIKVYDFLKKLHEKKLAKLYYELYLNTGMLLAFGILSGCFSLLPCVSAAAAGQLLLIGSLVAVLLQISSTMLEHYEERVIETDETKIKALIIKMYVDIFAHVLFPALSLLTNLVLLPALNFELPNTFVLLALMGITKVMIDLVHSIRLYHQEHEHQTDALQALHDLKISALKAFAMLELVGLIAWSEYAPLISASLSGLGFNPIMWLAISLFVAIHIYAHLNPTPAPAEHEYQLLTV